MTYGEIRERAGEVVNQNIIDYRPASGIFIDGMDDHEQIPNAIVGWLENGDKIVYIAKDLLRCRECGIILTAGTEDDLCDCCKDDRRDEDVDSEG